MSQQVTRSADGVRGLESGLEALQTSPEFHGPVESIDGHDCNDHFAQIYETDEERFAAAIPFVRHGLQQGERCMYVVDKSSKAEVQAAMCEAGIDVDAALSSGALTFHTVQDTYLRNGTFAPDDMIDLYAETVEDTTEEFEALRIVAETTWLQDDSTTVEQFMGYEARVNDLFAEEDCLALCQYDRRGFPPEVVRDIVQTHPHLIYDGTVCHNVYYTPPTEFFGDDAPAREVDRMLRTLRERTQAKAEVADHERFLRDLYEITSSQDGGFEEKLHALFELGCQRFDIDFGFLNRVDPVADKLEIEYASGDHDHYEVGGELPLSETYCQATVDIKAAMSISNPTEEGFDDTLVYEEFGVDAYLGTYIPVEGGADRTLAFVPGESREEPFAEQDKAFIELMGQWVGYELERRQREQFVRECYEITAAPALAFEEKLDALFEAGCKRFGLDYGGVARVDPDADMFEVEYVSGEHDYLVPGARVDLSETYCRVFADTGAEDTVSEPVGITDPEASGFADATCVTGFGVRTYLGTHLPIDGGLDRTFFFVSEEPRDREFTDEERTFERLMGQWVQYELERRQREQFLHECYEITADPALDFDEQLHRLLDLARERTGLEAAGLTHLPEWDGAFLNEYAIGYGEDGDQVVDAADEVWTDPSEGCYCRQVIESNEPVGKADVRGTSWENDQIYQQHNLTCYLGTKVTSGARPYGTLWVGGTEPRNRAFTDEERALLDLIGQWVSYEIERREYKESQRELYDITADPDRDFDGKLDALFELGCEQFDVDLGGMAVVDREGGTLEVEHVSSDHDSYEPGIEFPLSETFCESAVDTDEEVSVVDSGATGCTDCSIHRDHGFETYLGTHIEVDGGRDRTFFFMAEESRDVAFSDAERTFLDLMGQWVRYDLERQQHERELRERTNHLNALVETTPECIKTVAPDGTLLQMNATGLDMVEAPDESAVTGENVYDLIAPEHRERFRVFNERICDGECGTLEFDIIGLEGTRRHMESHARPLERPDGTTVQVALTRDVTEQKERKAELRRTKNRFETVFEQSDDGIFIIDPEADELVDANPAAATMVGYTRDELLSLCPSDLHVDEMEQFRAFLAEAQDQGSAWSEDLHCHHRNGHDIPTEITASAITLDGRDLVLALVRPIERRKKHERYQRDLYETTAAPDRSFEWKIEQLLELGRDRFDLEIGCLTHVTDDTLEIVEMVGDHERLSPGSTTPFSKTYCRKVIDSAVPVCVLNAPAEGWNDDPAYEAFGLDCYVGAPVTVANEQYGALCFASRTPRDRPFSDAERSFIELMGQWVSYELEREHREAQLGALNEMSRALMDVETPADIAAATIDHARESLQLPLTVLVQYDEQTGALAPAAQTSRAADEIPTAALCQRGEGALWDAFVATEERTLDNVASIPGAGADITEVVAVPLARQGLFVVGTRAEDGFSAAERDLLAATAATVEAALTRADREQQLHERERTLEEQNDTLQRLDRINDIIRNIDKALVQASNRGEIEAVVCEQLAEAGPYELAWIGDHDPVIDVVTPREWAGTAKGYLEEITVTTDDQPTGQGPVGRAIKTSQPQITNDILNDAPFEPWRQAALNRGYHATIALPLIYEDTLYGVLSVYASQPDVFDDLEQAVLTELSDNIAHAINAVESKKALVSDEAVELEFEVRDTGHPLVGLTDETDCEIALEGLVPRTDGQLRAFVSTWGVTAEEVIEAHPPSLAPDVDLVSHGERNGEPACLFEVELTDESISGVVLEHGGVVHEITAEDGAATVVVELSADAAIREFVEMFRTRHPSSELVAKRACERRRRTPTELYGALTEDLTPRQRETMQTAYFSGYFDQPRARTGSEIADSMGISQPTFNSHLRAAQRKLCRQLFEQSLQT